MPRVVVIDTKGALSEKNSADLSIGSLCKAAGVAQSTSFAKRATWVATADAERVSISVYARDTGRAGNENKYELPPPVAEPLYYSKMVVTGEHDSEPLEMSISLWKAVREKLFGGFEDLGASSDASEDEEIPAELATKDGYMLDGFVVDDQDETDDEDADSSACESVLSEDEFVSEIDEAESSN